MPREAAGGGFIYAADQYRVPFPPGTGQVTVIASKPVGYGMTITAVRLIAAVVAAGAGASRTFNVLKGTTIIASATVVLADLNALGAIKDIPLVAGVNADFLDADVMSLDWPAAGAVAFTAGDFICEIVTRKRIQQRN